MTPARPPATAGTGLAVAVAIASVLLGAMPRILLALDALPGPLRPFVWSDVLHLWERGVRDGQLPYRDVFFEYPPLTGALWAAIETVAASPVAHVAAWAAVQAAAAGVVALMLAREAGPRRTLLFWSLSPQLLLYGSVNFETLALVPLVIGVTLASQRRVVASSVALAVGTAVKLFPAAALPIVLARPFARRDRRAVIGGAAAFAAVLGATFAPTIAAPFSGLESLRRYSVGIEPNVDSIWGLGREVARAIGWDPIGLIVAATLVGTVATFALAVLPAAARSDRPAAAAGLAVATVMLWSRLYSPQYTLWLLPFFALAALPWRTFALLTLADVGVFLAIYPLTLLRWGSGDPVHLALTAALSAAVVLRHVGLVLAWRELWSRSGERAAS